MIWAEVSRGFDGGVVPTSASRGALKMPLDMKEEVDGTGDHVPKPKIDRFSEVAGEVRGQMQTWR